MAGDWIKMRTNLRSHPKVVRIASALQADKLRVVGGLHAVWSLFDEHSADGLLEGYTPDALDGEVGFPGFSRAMSAVKWLQIDPDGLTLPEFDEHNGQSAKRRAMETQRKRREREEEQAEEERRASALDADKKRTREEKRREERNTPQPPKGEPAGFADFWLAWPSGDRKQAKGKCLEAWKKAEAEPHAALVLAHVERMKGSPLWTKDGGQFVPAPLVYLNQRRWEGAGEDATENQREFV